MGLIQKAWRKIAGPSVEEQIESAVRLAIEKSLVEFESGEDVERPDSPTGVQTILSRAYLSVVWAFACMDIIAKDCANVPPVIKRLGPRKKGKRQVETLEDHPAYAIFDKPNEWQSWAGVVEEVIWNFLQWGRVALEKSFGDAQKTDGPLLGLKCLQSKFIEVTTSSDPGQQFKDIEYRVGNPANGKYPLFTPDKVIFFRKYDVCGSTVKGLSPLESSRFPLAIADGSQEFIASVLEKSPWAGWGLSGDKPDGGTYLKEIVNRVYTEIEHRVRGPKKAGLPLFLHTFKVQALPNALTNFPMEKINTGIRDQILAAFGVPPAKLGLMEYSSFSNAQEMDLRYWRQTIPPYMTAIYDALYRQWLVKEFPQDNLWIEPDYSAGLGQAAQTENEDRATKRWVGGVSTLNEAREMVGLEKDPDEEKGNKYKWETTGGGGFGQPPAAGGDLGPFNEQQRAAVEEARRREQQVEAEKGMKPLQKRRFDDADVFSFRKKLDDVVAQNEPKFAKWAHDLFSEQLDGVLDVIEPRMFGKSTIFKADEEEFNNTMESIRRTLDAIARKSQPQLADAYAGTLRAAANETIETVGFDLSFNVQNPRIGLWVGKKVLRLSTDVNDTTEEHLKEAIRDGLNAGEDYDQMEARVRASMADEMAPSHRPATIARTEGIDAANFGAVETYKQSGVVKRQQWLATGDDRTREAHAEVNGQVRELDAPFIVDGEELRWPGDSGLDASAENVCNCRCTVIPVIED